LIRAKAYFFERLPKFYSDSKVAATMSEAIQSEHIVVVAIDKRNSIDITENTPDQILY
jgi:hypothetical protein